MARVKIWEQPLVLVVLMQATAKIRLTVPTTYGYWKQRQILQRKAHKKPVSPHQLPVQSRHLSYRPQQKASLLKVRLRPNPTAFLISFSAMHAVKHFLPTINLGESSPIFLYLEKHLTPASEHIKLRRCRRHTCRLCSARFALKADLNRHMGTVHRDKQKPARTFVCNNPDCSVRNKQFLRKDNFERHVRRCMGESVMS